MAGTLTYGFGKPFGWTGAPGTCRWCGEKLPRTRVKKWVGWPEGSRPDASPWRDTGRVEVGYQDNGKFCTLRCGYQWAARNA